MFAVGHLALGYFSGRATGNLLDVNVSVPLMFLMSLLPDVDELIPGLEHRGPTHSLVVYVLAMLPFLALYGKPAIVYLASVCSHPLLGDLLVDMPIYGGVKLLWPLTSRWYAIGIPMESLIDVYLEWILFLVSLALLLRVKDLQKLLHPHPTNLLLTIPVLAIVLSIFLGIPLRVPLELFVPHAVLLILFCVSIITGLKYLLKGVQHCKTPL